MSARQGVTCAILAFNEEENLEAAVTEVHDELTRSGRPFEIVIIDDCSVDRTGPLADELAASRSAPDRLVRVIHHPKNLGPGSGIITGLEAARQPLYCFHPGDNQVRFADVAAALDLLDERYDLLVGERSDRHDYSPARKLASYGYIALARVLFGLHGYRDFNFIYLWRTETVRRMLPLDSYGVFLCTEILVRARDAGARIGVARAAYRPRTAGVSTVGRPSVVLDTFGQMMRFWGRRQLARVSGQASRSGPRP